LGETGKTILCIASGCMGLRITGVDNPSMVALDLDEDALEGNTVADGVVIKKTELNERARYNGGDASGAGRTLSLGKHEDLGTHLTAILTDTYRGGRDGGTSRGALRCGGAQIFFLLVGVRWDLDDGHIELSIGR
jgi:hypothetical protein